MSAALAALKVWLPPTPDAVIVLISSVSVHSVLTRGSRLLTPLCSVPKLVYRGLGETERVRIIRLPDAGVSFVAVASGEGTLPVDSTSSIACPSTDRDIFSYAALSTKRYCVSTRLTVAINFQFVRDCKTFVAVSFTHCVQVLPTIANTFYKFLLSLRQYRSLPSFPTASNVLMFLFSIFTPIVMRSTDLHTGPAPKPVVGSVILLSPATSTRARRLCL